MLYKSVNHVIWSCERCHFNFSKWSGSNFWPDYAIIFILCAQWGFENSQIPVMPTEAFFKKFIKKRRRTSYSSLAIMAPRHIKTQCKTRQTTCQISMPVRNMQYGHSVKQTPAIYKLITYIVLFIFWDLE